MVSIYKDTRDGKKYILFEEITMGSKICLVPMDKGEDKFISPSTLKRWYSKWEEADVMVEVKAFTGMKIGVFKVASYSKDECVVFTKNGNMMVFRLNHDYKLEDKQINAKNPKFANKIGMVYGMFIPYWLNK